LVFQASPFYGKIKRLYVDPACRGKSIVNKSIAQIGEATIAEGIAMVWL
jgi:hypothetical protein